MEDFNKELNFLDDFTGNYIFQKTIEIIREFPICMECLGRQFAQLGSGLSNYERGLSILNSLIMETQYREEKLKSEMIHLPKQFHEDKNKEENFNSAESADSTQSANFTTSTDTETSTEPQSFTDTETSIEPQSSADSTKTKKIPQNFKTDNKLEKTPPLYTKTDASLTDSNNRNNSNKDDDSEGNSDNSRDINTENGYNTEKTDNSNLEQSTLYKLVNLIMKNTNYPHTTQLLNFLKNKIDSRQIEKLELQHTSKKEDFQCFLCGNLFQKTPQIANAIINKVEDYDFSNFHVGTRLDPTITDREDEFKAKTNISTSESLKKNINRAIGIIIGKTLDKPANFNSPDIVFNINITPNSIDITINPNPLCIYGRYRKLIRGIPQTHWPHKECKGKGCEECNFTGKRYETSVEELMEPFFQKYAQGIESKFHGAGREDIDARCIGNGRPFIFEIKKPKKRNIPLEQIEREINEEVGDKIQVINLEFVSRSKIKEIKSKGEKTRKCYYALCESEKGISEEDFQKIFPKVQEILLRESIQQRTPLRVLHRRADITRVKKVFDIEGKWIDSKHCSFKLCVSGGTYVKELISGDQFRTTPSITEIFENDIVCKELDVLDINYEDNETN